MKSSFINLYNANIKREGADKLLEYLENTDFFSAPSSTRFHSAFEGGLCQHSLKVYSKLLELVKLQYGERWQDMFSAESIAIVGLLHDICKVNYYITELRNVKVSGGWTQRPYYTVHDKLPYGHGEKSVFIISNYMRLSAVEALAINWHMGGFDDRVKGGSYSISEAFDKYPLCVLLHTADLLASYLEEQRGE
ncbi:MAG: hydrolase [Clostridia bacterium]|nr:hydrolase [Clostridia bacterium]